MRANRGFWMGGEVGETYPPYNSSEASPPQSVHNPEERGRSPSVWGTSLVTCGKVLYGAESHRSGTVNFQSYTARSQWADRRI